MEDMEVGRALVTQDEMKIEKALKQEEELMEQGTVLLHSRTEEVPKTWGGTKETYLREMCT
jgi:hypothetical protein